MYIMLCKELFIYIDANVKGRQKIPPFYTDQWLFSVSHSFLENLTYVRLKILLDSKERRCTLSMKNRFSETLILSKMEDYWKSN